jgi:hypothetical protein
MELGEVIAVRQLRFASARDREVLVRLGRPQQTPGAADFCCPYQILGLGSGNVRGMCGVDAFQALQLTIEFIGLELERLSSLEGVCLHWDADDAGSLGFPKPG